MVSLQASDFFRIKFLDDELWSLLNAQEGKKRESIWHWAKLAMNMKIKRVFCINETSAREFSMKWINISSTASINRLTELNNHQFIHSLFLNTFRYIPSRHIDDEGQQILICDVYWLLIDSDPWPIVVCLRKSSFSSAHDMIDKMNSFNNDHVAFLVFLNSLFSLSLSRTDLVTSSSLLEKSFLLNKCHLVRRLSQ